MAKFEYTNESDDDLTLVGVGVVKAGDTIESDEPIENAYLKPKSKRKTVNKDEGDVS